MQSIFGFVIPAWVAGEHMTRMNYAHSLRALSALLYASELMREFFHLSKAEQRTHISITVYLMTDDCLFDGENMANLP